MIKKTSPPDYIRCRPFVAAETVALQGQPDIPGVQDLAEGGKAAPPPPSAAVRDARTPEPPFHGLALEGRQQAARG